MYKSPVRRFAPLFYWRTACVDAPDAMTAGWLHHALEVEGLEGQIPKVPPMFDQLIRAWRKLNQHRRLEIVLRFMSGPARSRSA